LIDKQDMHNLRLILKKIISGPMFQQGKPKAKARSMPKKTERAKEEPLEDDNEEGVKFF